MTNKHDELEPPRPSYEALYRVVLEIIPRLENRGMHLLHGVAELDAKSSENIALPRIVLRVHSGLHLFVVNDAYSERLLRIRCVES